MSLSTSIKYSSIKHRVAEYISKQISPLAPALGVDIIQKLCEDIPEVRGIIHGRLEKQSEQQEREMLVGLEFGHFIRDVFRWFADRNRRVSKKIIYKQYSEAAVRAKINFKAPEWKIIRTTVVEMIVTHLAAHAKENNNKGVIYSKTDIEECATRVFNQVLSEMKNVALCANVEEKQKARAERFIRSNSTTTQLPIFREPPRKSHSVSMRFQYSTSVDSVQLSEQQTLIHKV